VTESCRGHVLIRRLDSEVLTYFLESVPIVDRAFVHVDYLTYNVPTHMPQGTPDRV
jgi:hypothetical protein